MDGSAQTQGDGMGWIHSRFWFVAAAVLFAATIGLAVWAVVDDRAGGREGFAPDQVVAVLEGRIDAWTEGDLPAAAAFYATNGILEEMDQSPPIVTQGRSAIAQRLQDLYDMGLRLKVAGAPIQNGRFVAEPVIYYTPNPADEEGLGMLVFEMSPDGQIVRQWAY